MMEWLFVYFSRVGLEREYSALDLDLGRSLILDSQRESNSYDVRPAVLVRTDSVPKRDLTSP